MDEIKHILDELSFRVETKQLMERLRVKAGTREADELAELVQQAERVACPKALYRLGFVDKRSTDTVIIDGVTFASRILAVNLEHAHRVFVYAATCGQELQEWADGIPDLLQKFWAEAIQEMALREATRALNSHIIETYHPGPSSTMAPGSLGDWPLTQQRALFTLLGDTQATIGLCLCDSMLMVPFKSISGIRFPTEERFESCMLCPRADCPGRRALYDRDMHARRYQHEIPEIPGETA